MTQTELSEGDVLYDTLTDTRFEIEEIDGSMIQLADGWGSYPEEIIQEEIASDRIDYRPIDQV